METITQTNRTILFAEINPERLNLLTLVGDVRGKSSLDDDKIKEINEELLVSSFEEFLAGRVPPCETRVSSKAASTSCTMGPLSLRPVSRHGSMPLAGLPCQAEDMHRPLTKATFSSTIIDFR